MGRWQRAGAALGGMTRRRLVRLVVAGVAGLLVLALTWAAAVASVSGSAAAAAAVEAGPGWAAPPGSGVRVTPDSTALSGGTGSSDGTRSSGAGPAGASSEAPSSAQGAPSRPTT